MRLEFIKATHAVSAAVAVACLVAPCPWSHSIAAVAVVDVGLLKLLKRVVGLPRPSGGPKSGYGMPSAHAAQLSLISIASAVWFLTSIMGNAPATHAQSSGTLCAVSCLYFLREWDHRVRSRRHTRGQMMYGALWGSVLAVWLVVGVRRFAPSIAAATGFP